ncbi:uncharacterized protein LOC129984229 [Argiope bruennichi]|uniref:uncharacterized protein LOC129984229 n=1 Tax=Argiope bruennichi TaxID=94029 RepID=UPI002494C0E8|nr:uncharacterized protein LOC129984229 [Argiope bruennichi]XP_055950033.1 uncharacterized protein LOC129984229 [Argiope bruennichi]
MSRFLLLILLSSWSLLVSPSSGCETGVAFVDSALSIQRSLMANADVALLKSFVAPTLERCMEECCSGKYGACSVASFKKNATKENCIHYNCRPLRKCKFLSSHSTDSFTFSSNPVPPKSVPSKQPSTVPSLMTDAKTNGSQPAHTKEEIATFSNEQFALKNDNTSVKPRKGVHDLQPDDLLSKSGIKPRKGVSLEDVPHSQFLLSNNKSNVKPRKGVEPYSSEISPTPSVSAVSTLGRSNVSSSVSHFHTTLLNTTEDFASDDLMSALQRVFEDDSHSTSIQSSTSSKISPTSTLPLLDTTSHSESHSTSAKLYSAESRTSAYSSYTTQASLKPSQNTPEVSSSSPTPTVDAGFFTRPSKEFTTSTIVSSSTTYFLTVTKTSQPPTLPPLPSEVTEDQEEKFVEELSVTDEETENDRKYKSSIHLVLSLVFGLLVLFAVLGVVAKRIYDGWLRRDYYRMNYLIDGIYNGVD